MAAFRLTWPRARLKRSKRLLYVAMTRAKDELDLIVPQRFYTFHQSKVGDQHVYACRSRFIPDVILASFDAYSWHERVQMANRPAKKTGATTDVAASLIRMCRLLQEPRYYRRTSHD
jgi:ATP-dependent DNA helicase UvrD/PcrA